MIETAPATAYTPYQAAKMYDIVVDLPGYTTPDIFGVITEVCDCRILCCYMSTKVSNYCFTVPCYNCTGYLPWRVLRRETLATSHPHIYEMVGDDVELFMVLRKLQSI